VAVAMALHVRVVDILVAAHAKFVVDKSVVVVTD